MLAQPGGPKKVSIIPHHIIESNTMPILLLLIFYVKIDSTMTLTPIHPLFNGNSPAMDSLNNINGHISKPTHI